MYPIGMPDYMGWMMFGSYVFWFVLVAVGVFFLARLSQRTDTRRNARSILEERLARGEITDDEFRTRLALLAR